MTARLAADDAGSFELYNEQFASNPATAGWGYQLYMNTYGQLEVNVLPQDGSTVFTLATFNAFGGAQQILPVNPAEPPFVVQSAAQFGAVALYASNGLANRRIWYEVPGNDGTLALMSANDAGAGYPWLVVATAGDGSVDHIEPRAPVKYVPTAPTDWAGTPPADIASALDRIAGALAALGHAP